MLKLFQGLSRWLANYTSIFVIGVAVFTFFFPHTFDWVRGTTQTVILGIIMLTMGLTLTTNDFKILAQRPLDVFIGACAQFIIMPGVAYTLVHVWHLDPALALGILLVGCCPGGVSSNIMSYLCHGDVAFSVGMTCASTILAPVMTPLLMKITAGEIIHVDAVGMFINILIVTIIPVAIGCALNYVYGKKGYFPTIQSLMPGISVTCLAIIVGGVISRRSGSSWLDAFPLDFRRGILPQHLGLPPRMALRKTRRLQYRQEAYHLHRGGYAECWSRHSACWQLLRRPATCRSSLRHQLCLA